MTIADISSALIPEEQNLTKSVNTFSTKVLPVPPSHSSLLINLSNLVRYASFEVIWANLNCKRSMKFTKRTGGQRSSVSGFLLTDYNWAYLCFLLSCCHLWKTFYVFWKGRDRVIHGIPWNLCKQGATWLQVYLETCMGTNFLCGKKRLWHKKGQYFLLQKVDLRAE